MKKKIIIVLLAATMAVPVGACGNGKQGASQDTAQADDTGKDPAKAEQGEVESQADKITYEVEKYVTLGDYSALEISLPNTYEVTQEQVDDYAQSMAEYNATPVYKDTDKQTVEEGDTVNIDYEGKKDGVAFKGGTAAGYNLTIGSHSFIDGFEEGLVGKKVGETVDLDLTFPEGYQSEELAGAAVVFTVKVNKIVEEDPDAKFELNDEYVQQNYDFESVAEYKENVKDYLEMQMESDKQKDTRQAVLDKLLEICEVTTPDGLLEARVSDYVEQFTNDNCSDGTTLDEYLASHFNEMTAADFRSDVTSELQGTLKTELILDAIAQQEGIELEEDAFQEYVQQMMSAYNYATADDFYKTYGVDVASGEAYQRKVFVRNKALDKVIESAKIEYGVTQDGK